MQLESLTVENFRAIRSAHVSFDATTVLIGENDCGLSSLLEALALALDAEADGTAPRFQPYHFHRQEPRPDAAPAGPIRIELCFRERRKGEWNALADSPLGPLLDGPARERRILVLEIRAVPARDDAAATAEWRLRRDDLPAGRVLHAPEALAFLRRMSPLIRMRGGLLVDAAPAAKAATSRRAPELPPDTAHLVERIEAAYAEAITGTTPDIEATLREGFAAARELLAGAARHLDGEAASLRKMVAEILDAQRLPSNGGAPVPARFAGTSAERVGVLALTATLLRVLPGALAPGVEPIWVLENPEANLHPMTLASVLHVVDSIKWQKILTTHSGEVLAGESLASLRRLTRRDSVLREWRVRPRRLSADDLRRVDYHLRTRRSVASFARCWLLVEGETEFWVLPELARLAGHDFAREGIACVEFAQCGLAPLIRLARELGIEWHVLTDGDRAGEHYVAQARRFLGRAPYESRITALRERDIENCFFAHGYADLYRRLAGPESRSLPARHVIDRAIRRHSKPMLALELVLEAATRGPGGVPEPVAKMVGTCMDLARNAGAAPGAPRARHKTTGTNVSHPARKR